MGAKRASHRVALSEALKIYYEDHPEARQVASEKFRGRRFGQKAAGWFIDSGGYKVLTMQYDHPLADSHYKVAEHRAVLYSKIGPGPHPCFWCGQMLSWGGREGICSDHLDHDLSNNDPMNLVPSCSSCNSKRQLREHILRTHCSAGHEMTERNTYVKPNGNLNCRTCRRLSAAKFRARRKVRYGRQARVDTNVA